MMVRFYQFFSLLFCLVTVRSAPQEDLITHLPGLAQLPPFKQYSGYLDASPEKHFHYWFVESQRDPQSDPIVVWLNGGPGCSSLDGLLSENGPIHVNNDGNTLYMNPYSWNKIASVIYLESPAGVGYSYDDNNNVKTHDNEVASHNYAALQNFFKKFPEYAKNDLYITGESYGGIYVPTLTLEIAKGKLYNLKGFAVGNGLSSYKLNDDSLVYFAYYHGLFGEKLWNNMLSSCCKGGFTRQNCSFHQPPNAACSDYVQSAFNLVYNSGLNEYALYLDCEDTNLRETTYRFTMANLFRRAGFDNKKILQAKVHRSRSLGDEPPCINSTAEENWLNKADVRDALHIPKSLPKWDVCSAAVGSQFGRDYMDMTNVYRQLLDYPDLRALVYNGDIDMACNFLGDQWFLADLKLPEVTSRHPWYVKGQVGGFAREFKKVTFTTIRGAGHMVPQWAPEYAFVMIDKFLKNEPLI